MNYDRIKRSNAFAYIRKNVKERRQGKDIGKVIRLSEETDIDVEEIYSEILCGVQRYIGQMTTGSNFGKFAAGSNAPNLYSYVYLAMLYGLSGMQYEEGIKETITQKLLNAQYKDGLFYDRNILNYEYLVGDGWGARHLIPHMLIAMERLEIEPVYEFSFLSALSAYDNMYSLMDALDWTNVWRTSNYVMNVGVCMQYERDHREIKERQDGIRAVQDWLVRHIREDCGMWYKGKPDSISARYEIVRGAYHLFPLLFYDAIDIPHMEKAVDLILSLQNKYGGFDLRKNASACEDIDAVEPLIRLSVKLPGYREEEIQRALKKALFWIRQNQGLDGGFVFRKGELFNYGNVNMSSHINESNLFATWFRTLSVCYIRDYLLGIQHDYTRVPGYEFPLW